MWRGLWGILNMFDSIYSKDQQYLKHASILIWLKLKSLYVLKLNSKFIIFPVIDYFFYILYIYLYNNINAAKDLACPDQICTNLHKYTVLYMVMWKYIYRCILTYVFNKCRNILLSYKNQIKNWNLRYSLQKKKSSLPKKYL